MVQAIAKRRQLPTSGTQMASLDSTRGVSRPGPNSSAAFAAGKEMTLTSLSVSSAKRTGPGAFSGATIHAGRASAPDVSGRNATAVAGPPTAAATCAGSHSGMARTAASPERKAGGGPGSTSVSPNASRSSAAQPARIKVGRSRQAQASEMTAVTMATAATTAAPGMRADNAA